MKKESVLELKNQVLESLSERRGATQTEVLSIPRVESRLAVGYSQKSDGEYQLELRVQKGRGAAYRKAQKFKEQAKKEANIEIIPRVYIPSQNDITDKPRPPLARTGRPLHLGLSIGHQDGGVGTLGAFVSDARDRDCILSNNHVLALMNQARNGAPIYQPGNPDRWPLTSEDEIAKLSRFIIVVKSKRNLVDAALAVIGKDIDERDIEHDSNRIPRGLGYPMEGRMISEADPPESVLELLKKDTPVCKIGRTTGYTEGTIGAVALDNVPVKTPIGIVVFDDVIQVNWESNNKPFSEPGDSGSLVFTKENPTAIGLHFAGGERRVEGKELKVSYSCNIFNVLKTLEASLLD